MKKNRRRRRRRNWIEERNRRTARNKKSNSNYLGRFLLRPTQPDHVPSEGLRLPVHERCSSLVVVHLSPISDLPLAVGHHCNRAVPGLMKETTINFSLSEENALLYYLYRERNLLSIFFLFSFVFVRWKISRRFIIIDLPNESLFHKKKKSINGYYFVIGKRCR